MEFYHAFVMIQDKQKHSGENHIKILILYPKKLTEPHSQGLWKKPKKRKKKETASIMKIQTMNFMTKNKAEDGYSQPHNVIRCQANMHSHDKFHIATVEKSTPL